MSATYRDRIVSFIDILGFANAIERSASDQALVEGIYAALNTAPFSSPLHGPPNFPDSISWSRAVKATNFSDSIVISAERSVVGLVTVMEMSRAFACVLLQLGMLARGGVACGPLIHEDHLIFGPGLVRAYRLESEAAKVARIIIDEDTIDFARECGRADPSVSEYLGASLRVDCDGLTYLHVLRELGEDMAAGKDGPLQQGWWGTARKTISDQLVGTRGQPFANKVEWFARYYNREVIAHEDCSAEDDWRTQLEVPPS